MYTCSIHMHFFRYIFLYYLNFFQLFRCYNMRILSLKYNCLEAIPADIGRLRNLEYLALTNNRLQIHSLPYTLAFCGKLHTILLDNNQLDALPGFLLDMTSIETVHRHGNHNYFKSTFMWYHTDVDYRIIPTSGTNVIPSVSPDTLQFMAARSIIGSRKDFFNDPDVAGVLKDFISDIFLLFNVCSHCSTVMRTYLKGIYYSLIHVCPSVTCNLLIICSSKHFRNKEIKISIHSNISL